MGLCAGRSDFLSIGPFCRTWPGAAALRCCPAPFQVRQCCCPPGKRSSGLKLRAQFWTGGGGSRVAAAAAALLRRPRQRQPLRTRQTARSQPERPPPALPAEQALPSLQLLPLQQARCP